jgi:hypothetical protein
VPSHNHSAIVVTTIFEPIFLNGYLENIRWHGWQESATFFIIPDRETPTSVYAAATEALKRGFDVRIPNLEEQVQFLKKLDLPDDFIPWNTDNRRNVGFLMALETGCDVIISIDDDNFCRPEVDFVGEHLVVGKQINDNMVSTSDGWFNNCSLLDTDVPIEIFPRGFPYFARNNNRTIETGFAKEESVVAINAGLWLDDPDVDAVTRLSLSPQAQAFKPTSIILGADTWSPINTQNTALTREAALAFYYARMGYPLKGLKIDRYGDILSGYFVQKCAKHLGQAVRFGPPVCEHKRTPHNLLKDLYHELAGMVLIEELLPWFLELQLEGSTYLEAYSCLADHLASASKNFKGFIWNDGGRDFLVTTSKHMRIWLDIVKRLL